MQIRSALVIVAGLVLAGGSAFVARDMMAAPVPGQAAASVAPAGPEMASVIVVSRDIGFGEMIAAEDLALMAWPKDAVPANAFSSLDAVLGTGTDRRSARSAIAAGEVLLSNRVTGFGEKVTILQSLTAGHRAMTIEVDAVSGVAGFVNPGDFVDVVLTERSSGELRARTIMQKVRVIGVDQTYDKTEAAGQGVARTITVEVTPEDGQRLALAQRAGALSLTLVSTDGDSVGPLPALSLNDLLGIEDEAPEPEIPVATLPEDPKRMIVVRRGIDVETVELEN